MAKTDFMIKTSVCRPCFIDGRTRGLFHRWEDKKQIIVKFKYALKPDKIQEIIDNFKNSGFIPNTADTEETNVTLAIVELEDGSIKEVEPSKVKFLDSYGKFNEICWEFKRYDETPN